MAGSLRRTRTTHIRTSCMSFPLRRFNTWASKEMLLIVWLISWPAIVMVELIMWISVTQLWGFPERWGAFARYCGMGIDAGLGKWSSPLLASSPIELWAGNRELEAVSGKSVVKQISSNRLHRTYQKKQNQVHYCVVDQLTGRQVILWQSNHILFDN